MTVGVGQRIEVAIGSGVGKWGTGVEVDTMDGVVVGDRWGIAVVVVVPGEGAGEGVSGAREQPTSISRQINPNRAQTTYDLFIDAMIPQHRTPARHYPQVAAKSVMA